MKRHGRTSYTAPTQTTGTRRAAFGLACLCILGFAAFLGSAAPVASAAETCANESRRIEQGSTALPDCRAWELVSPAGKNGADVLVQPMRTRASVDGNAVNFASLSGFGDALGMGIAAEYISRRDALPGTRGWSTHSVFPKLEPISGDAGGKAMDSLYTWELSDDLSKGILRTLTNLSGDPDLANTTNLYLREDLLTPGAGTYQTLSSCPACTAPLNFPTFNPNVADATPDFGHIIFESKNKLTPDAPTPPPICLSIGIACPVTLYEWDHGTLRIAGVLPESEGGGVAPNSLAGAGPPGPRYTQRTISDDGSRIFFTNPTENGAVGPIYMRENHASTVQINASERTVPEEAMPAEFRTASADGSRVLFTTPENLVDEDNNNSTDLYLYDADLPASDPHNLTLLTVDEEPADEEANVQAVFGASDDGAYVYFAASEQLAADAPPLPGESGIFLWHDGVIKHIGTFMSTGDIEPNSMGRSWGIGMADSRVSPDGRHLLFTASAGGGLTGYDHTAGGPPNCGNFGTGGCSELYLYDAGAEHLTCASCNPSGAPAVSDASFSINIGTGGSAPSGHITHPLSADGSRVFFSTGDRLVPGDRNGRKRDVYAYDATDGSLRLLTSGRGSEDSYFLDASADGRDVFFVTRERLSAWDVDGSFDLYDARVGGGFLEPPTTPAPCLASACQGSPPANAPGLPAGTTASFIGPGNAAARSAHRKKKKKAHRKKHHAQKRAAHSNRGGTR